MYHTNGVILKVFNRRTTGRDLSRGTGGDGVTDETESFSKSFCVFVSSPCTYLWKYFLLVLEDFPKVLYLQQHRHKDLEDLLLVETDRNPRLVPVVPSYNDLVFTSHFRQ